MSGFVALLRKDALEIVRTWRLWVLPGLLLLFAIIGPLSARFVRELMSALLPAGQDGMQITLPDPTWRDTLGQWWKNLSQAGLIAVLLVGGGMISTDRRQGTQVLVLTKPVSRWAYVVATYVAQAAFVVVATLLGLVVELGVTRALFPDAQAWPAIRLTLVWLLLALVLLAVTLVGSAAFDSGLAASGVGLGAMVVLSLVALWRGSRYTPAGLNALASDIVTGTANAGGWAIGTGAATCVALVLLAGAVFARREL